MALVVAGTRFSAVGLKGDLGALIVGVLLASHLASSELARSLFHLKRAAAGRLLHRLGIGLTRTARPPDGRRRAVDVVAAPGEAVSGSRCCRCWGCATGRRSWPGWSLMNYSGSGLIVVSVGVTAKILDKAWLVEMSIAVALVSWYLRWSAGAAA